MAFLAVQALVVVLPLRAVGLPLVLGAVLLLAALVVLLGVARERAPARVPLLALGLLLNLLVVVANLGMPVAAETLERAGIGVEQPAPTARTPSTSWSAAAPGWACSATGWPSGRCAP